MVAVGDPDRVGAAPPCSFGAAADAAAGRDQRGMGRYMRSELLMLSALPVAELRNNADELARQLRELDMQIQRSNWEVDLLD